MLTVHAVECRRHGSGRNHECLDHKCPKYKREYEGNDDGFDGVAKAVRFGSVIPASFAGGSGVCIRRLGGPILGLRHRGKSFRFSVY